MIKKLIVLVNNNTGFILHTFNWWCKFGPLCSLFWYPETAEML